jgi:hypothetical protein
MYNSVAFWYKRRMPTSLVQFSQQQDRFFSAVQSPLPLLDAGNCAIGVAGIMHDLEKAGATLAPYQRLSQAISHISNHLCNRS